VFTLRGLVVALLIEAAVIVSCLIALLLLRWRIGRRKQEVEDAVRAVEPVLHNWLVLDANVSNVVLTLRRLPPHAALLSLARLVTKLAPFERQQALAGALRHEPWVEAVLRRARSPLWWRRFDVARLLSIVGGENDAGLIASLLGDGSPAVRLVAFDAAARLTQPALINRALDDVPARQDAVQAYQFAALGRHAKEVADALIPRLTPDAPMGALNAWIDAAGALASPEALRCVRHLSSHPRAEVRVHIARALRRLAEAETVPVLLTLLADQDWRVRAQAARALGALRVGSAADALAIAVRDPAWWVRYRSALALAQIGGNARVALIDVASGDDRMARDMAQLVSGLSSAAVIEMSEV
jgi:HEAT repeat protein